MVLSWGREERGHYDGSVAPCRLLWPALEAITVAVHSIEGAKLTVQDTGAGGGVGGGVGAVPPEQLSGFHAPGLRE
jgi:hypothetical protein